MHFPTVSLNFRTVFKEAARYLGVEPRFEFNVELKNLGRGCRKTRRYVNLLRLEPDDFDYNRRSKG